MSCEPVSRRYAHSEGATHLIFNSKRHIVTCGSDCDVRTFVGLEDDDVSEFSVSSSKLTALVCYTAPAEREEEEEGGGADVVAVAMDDNTVQAFTTNGSCEGILMRFTAPVTCLDVSVGHTYLAAGSAEFTIKVVEIADSSKTYTLHGHEAPLLWVKFDPREELLASSCCDGAVKIWSLQNKVQPSSKFSMTANSYLASSVLLCKKREVIDLVGLACEYNDDVLAPLKPASMLALVQDQEECIQTLPLLPKCNDVTLAPSLCHLAWQPSIGKILAIPVGSEVKVYERTSWKCLFSLSDEHHQEAINVMSWSPCGKYLASGAIDGTVVLWSITGSRNAYKRCTNESGMGITSLEWDPRGRGSEIGEQLIFADLEGYVGAFDNVYPPETESTNQIADETIGSSSPVTNDDPLVDDSLLMEGIPADDIFDNFDDDVMDDGHHGNFMDDEAAEVDDNDEDEIVQSRKRRRFDSEGEDPGVSDLIISDEHSNQSDARLSTPLADDQLTNEIAPPTYFKKPGPVFSEKMIEKCHTPFQSSATPEHLQHRFLVYNLVGVVRSHSDDEASMVEVEFHNTSTHHSFSLPNPSGYSMAALSEQALVLATEKQDEQSSQLHCVHFGSWDSNRDWSVSLTAKESIRSIAVGDGWIAIATNKQMLRLFSVGGVQREVISVPGRPVTLSGWGGRLAIVYQAGPCTENVFSLSVWVLDVKRRRQLHPPHSLPLSQKAKLEWIGFSEEGVLFSYDTKGMVRVLVSGCYGGLSWIPVLDTTKQLGNKSDHYFIVGMTHNPDELRAILCKGLDYPPVQPKPVMNTLQLHLPLCDATSDKSSLESQYIQTWLLSGRPGVDSGPAQVQHLMKLFALACKSDHEYRAYEIAGMMPDEHSMNLALTYASRTHHVRLARHISELIQMKSLEGFSDEDENDLENPVGQFYDDGWTNQDADDDVTYAQSRSHSLNKRTDLASKSSEKKFPLLSKFGKGSSLSATDGRSKFNRYMDQVKRGKYLSSSSAGGGSKTSRSSKGDQFDKEDSSNKRREQDSDDENSLDANNYDLNDGGMGALRGYDETKELFSDTEQEQEEGDGHVTTGDGGAGVLGGEGEGEGGGGGSDDETIDDFSFTPSRNVGSTGKRANPFKMATPVSKRIQQDRKSTFLDNISAQAVGEEQRKKEKKSRDKSASESGGGLGGGGGGKGTKRKASGGGKTTAAGAGGSGAAKKQSSLKSTFFKQPSLKATTAKKTPTPPPLRDDSEPAAANDRDKPTNQDGEDAMEDDQHVMTTDNDHVTSSGDIAESVRQSSKQKLADLAFKPASEP